ncbi:hypothetical protein ABT282_37385 [Streptomyces sp. NPDC000927]|uniref:hypothetical protein n=1 Tax=unclassified Streptomyces TaxID=2593676 RepID=UPI00331971A9
MTENLMDDVTAPRPPRTWIASLLSTVVTLPLACVALMYAGLSPMACDPCNGAEAHRFDASFEPAWTVFTCGLVLALITLVASWVLWRRRPPAGLALAVTAPGVVLLATLVFTAMVDWP